MRFDADRFELDLALRQGGVLQPCPLCSRPMTARASVDEHHLTPKSQGGKDKFLVHRVCHQKIHATLRERELAKHYFTWEALRAHPELAKFIEWLQNKPHDFVDINRKTRAMRRK